MTRMHLFFESFENLTCMSKIHICKIKMTCFVKEVNKETTHTEINTDTTNKIKDMLTMSMYMHVKKNAFVFP